MFIFPERATERSYASVPGLLLMSSVYIMNLVRAGADPSGRLYMSKWPFYAGKVSSGRINVFMFDLILKLHLIFFCYILL